MHTPLLVGSLFFFAATSVGVALFFLQAWRAQPDDRKYLAFGALTLSFAAHATVGGLIYARVAGMHSWSTVPQLFDVVVIPSKFAIAFCVHFTLLHSRVRRARSLATAVYVLMGTFVVLGLLGMWWTRVEEPTTTSWFGLSMAHVTVVPSAWARPFYVVTPALIGSCVYLFARSNVRTRKGMGALLGSILLAAAGIHDLGLGAGWIRSIPLFPFGFVALTWGVALTLVSRYASTARDLELSTAQVGKQSDELERSYADLRRTQHELVRSEQLAVIGELAAVIAHEVRNPLAIVSNAVASLRKRRTNRNDRKTLLGIINEEMGRLDGLVGRLIHYARPVVLERTPVALEAVLHRSALILEGTAIGVVVRTGSAVGPVEIDEELMRQAFENIFTNAMQSGVQQDIVVTLSRRNVGGVSVVAVAIEDDGEGMTADQLASALTPFFTTRPTGTGLGLPIVTRIVEAHGGQVQIDSERGKGTTVTLMLPLSSRRSISRTADAGRISVFP